MAEEEAKQELKRIQEEIRELDRLISKKDKLLKFVKSATYDDIVKEFDNERLSAIEDFLKDNTPVNQAYARLWNYICNLLELLKDPTELNNLLSQKETLLEQLGRMHHFTREQSFDREGGGGAV